jgi:predicted GIY-YIG superfamily endonuclease
MVISDKISPPDTAEGIPSNQEHFVYILKCADGSFYVGSTHDRPKVLSFEKYLKYHPPKALAIKRLL